VTRDAVRLAPGQHGVTRRVGNRFAGELVRRAAVELEVAGAGCDIGTRLLERLAAIACFDLRELFGMSWISRPSFARSLPFSAGDIRPHAPSRARCAASTARSISTALPDAIEAKASPYDGSIIGSVAPVAAATQRFAMKCAAGVVTGGSGPGAFMAAFSA
jgi:hypothetical protein